MSLKNRLRTAAASVFPFVEPVRTPWSLIAEAMGRVSESKSIKELEEAGQFIRVKGVQTLPEIRNGDGVKMLEMFYAQKAGELFSAANAHAARNTPKKGSMEQWFADMATTVKEATPLDAIATTGKLNIPYSRTDSIRLQAFGHLQFAELKHFDRMKKKYGGEPSSIDAAAQFIVESGIRNLVSVEESLRIVRRHEEIRQDVLDEITSLPRTEPKTLADIERDAASIAYNNPPAKVKQRRFALT